jgi:formylglycine-generating enzyme required for sulfatase activity
MVENGNIIGGKYLRTDCPEMETIFGGQTMSGFHVKAFLAVSLLGCFSALFLGCGGSEGTPDVGGGYDGGTITGEMVTVPAGSFQMGCNSAVDSQCYSMESPYHPVNLSAFTIDKYEVTVGEYKMCVDSGSCMAAGPSAGCNYGVLGRDRSPVNCISWPMADIYCKWAGKRLPTEAEWEKAARGTDGRKYPWGNTEPGCDHAVMNVGSCFNSGTQPAGSKPLGVSPYGAEDMIGNVWEWVSDWYDPSYYSASPADNPQGPSSGKDRIIRGGDFSIDSTRFLRASTRISLGPAWENRSIGVGFRCVR